MNVSFHRIASLIIVLAAMLERKRGCWNEFLSADSGSGLNGLRRDAFIRLSAHHPLTPLAVRSHRNASGKYAHGFFSGEPAHTPPRT
jgi:hypothetical protein